MRLLPLVALTLWLAGASARVGGDPYQRYRKHFGKGLTVAQDADVDDEETDDDEDDANHKMDPHDDEKDKGDGDAEVMQDDTENSGKTKETSVHKKHFMDQYFLHSGPVKYEFGHVCEDPDDWQQRYEKRDFGKHSHQGQVKWGDANGGYGEQLWDFNHAGSLDDDDSDWKPGRKDRKNGNKAMGVIKEKVTITKKKNGKTVDQTSINREKLADLNKLVKSAEPKPFAGDEALIREFEKKTKGVTKKENPFEEEQKKEEDDDDEEDEDGDEYEEQDDDDDDDGFFDFGEIRRMGSTGPLQDDRTKKRRVSVQEHNVMRRYDVMPSASERSRDLVTKATINIDTPGKVNFDPITGSITDRKTGKKFKIFGVLVDKPKH